MVGLSPQSRSADITSLRDFRCELTRNVAWNFHLVTSTSEVLEAPSGVDGATARYFVDADTAAVPGTATCRQL